MCGIFSVKITAYRLEALGGTGEVLGEWVLLTWVHLCLGLPNALDSWEWKSHVQSCSERWPSIGTCVDVNGSTKTSNLSFLLPDVSNMRFSHRHPPTKTWYPLLVLTIIMC